MNKYAIFIDDCEIHIDLEIGTIDSLDAIREVIAEEMKAHPNFEHGVVEHYPFWRGYWEVVGYALPVGLDKNTILEVQS